LPVTGKNLRALKVFKLVKKQINKFTIPSVTQFSSSKSPYRVLISCVLSLRTKDKTTIEAAKRLFKVAATPGGMVKLSPKSIEKLIYPVGFYRNKARVILNLSGRIIRDFKGLVPSRREELLSFKGVGRKTANLVLGLGFNIPAICVDTHVHRISNRLGWVNTITPDDTETALSRIFPKNLWIELNTALVTFGQNLCVPISPFCSACNATKFCKKVGVEKSR